MSKYPCIFINLKQLIYFRIGDEKLCKAPNCRLRFLSHYKNVLNNVKTLPTSKCQCIFN